jgi:hypothetical protein
MVALTGALTLLALWVWYYAIRYEEGVITACVDCSGEGAWELAFFWALSLTAANTFTFLVLAVRGHWQEDADA